MCLLVFTADEGVARWAATPVELGGKNWFRPHVLGPSAIPEVIEESDARSNPELAVLSAMAHGRDADVHRSVQIAMTAQRACRDLDDERATLYCDLTMTFLAEAARNALESMDTQKYEYKSDFARRYFGLGKVAGRSSLIARQLTVRFGGVSADIETRLRSASVEELDAIGERLLNARSLHEALGWSEPQPEALG